jgi:hypothetical protein
LVLAGCATTSTHLPPVNLKEPGWTIREGQAVWLRQRGGEGVAGEILVATRADGRAFVQFSKTPFPLIIAQETRERWAVEIPPQNKKYAGRGAPPKRLIWLYLARALQGKPPPSNWKWRQDADGWHLETPRGESVEGYFSQ